jgi:hypothetical protein
MPSHLRRAAAAIPIVLCTALVTAACGGDAGDGNAADQGMDIADVGFATPESVLADTIADVYYVSNINGDPVAEDDNGFISRVRPDGTVENLKWIDGAVLPQSLNAPKGMAIRGDTLFVADIKCLRLYSRVTGERITEICMDAATFLNDIAVGGADNSLFVTDSGLKAGAAGLEPTGSDAIFRLPIRGTQPGATIARDPEMGNPNGIAVCSRGILVVTYGSGEILRFTPDGEESVMVRAGVYPQLDGIVCDNSGGFAFSSWGNSAVYHVDGSGAVHTVAEGIDAPADIGFDPKRNRLMIPLFNENKVLFRDLGSTPDAGAGAN